MNFYLRPLWQVNARRQQDRALVNSGCKSHALKIPPAAIGDKLKVNKLLALAYFEERATWRRCGVSARGAGSPRRSWRNCT